MWVAPATVDGKLPVPTLLAGAPVPFGPAVAYIQVLLFNTEVAWTLVVKRTCTGAGSRRQQPVLPRRASESKKEQERVRVLGPARVPFLSKTTVKATPLIFAKGTLLHQEVLDHQR